MIDETLAVVPVTPFRLMWLVSLLPHVLVLLGCLALVFLLWYRRGRLWDVLHLSPHRRLV